MKEGEGRFDGICSFLPPAYFGGGICLSDKEHRYSVRILRQTSRSKDMDNMLYGAKTGEVLGDKR